MLRAPDGEMTPSVETAGAAASKSWLDDIGLDPKNAPHWYVEISIESDEPGTRFDLNVYPEEWGFVFRSGSRVSSIRCTDVAFVHGSDDHHLLREVPHLADIPKFLGALEQRYGAAFVRHRALVRSNIVRAGAVVKAWLVFV